MLAVTASERRPPSAASVQRRIELPDAEIVFQVREAPEGGYTARALGYSIFTEGDDWEHLKFMLRDAVLCYFDDDEAPRAIRVHLVQNEIIPV